MFLLFQVVQEALDRARQGRTCFVIAHRLSTIQVRTVKGSLLTACSSMKRCGRLEPCQLVQIESLYNSYNIITERGFDNSL